MLGAACGDALGAPFEGVGWVVAGEWRREPWRDYGADPPHVFRLVLAGEPWLRAAGAIAGARHGAALAIPRRWPDRLENASRIADLGSRLGRRHRRHTDSRPQFPIGGQLSHEVKVWSLV